MNYLNRFHSSIESIRSHHWKYYVDLFSSCTYHCKYCLYRGNDLNQDAPCVPSAEALKAEMHCLSEPGIIYLGARADVYQHGKDINKTRNVFSVFLESQTPVFVVTRSPEIMKDADILQDMSKQGLIEVSITINTRNDKFRARFEPGTIEHAQRLALAKKLVQVGIPVSFHFSPIIPGLDDTHTLISIMDDMQQTGADCIYACLYGMSTKYREPLIHDFDSVKPGLRASLSEIYKPQVDTPILSPGDEAGLKIIRPLAEYARKNKALFVSAQFPTLDTGIREGGIFRHKLPTISDLLHAATQSGKEKLVFADIDGFIEKHPAVDLEYRAAIKSYWDSGELFKNTAWIPVYGDHKHIGYYEKAEQLDIDTRVMSCRQ